MRMRVRRSHARPIRSGNEKVKSDCQKKSPLRYRACLECRGGRLRQILRLGSVGLLLDRSSWQPVSLAPDMRQERGRGRAMRSIRGRGAALFEGQGSPREEHLRLLAAASQVLAASFDLAEPLRQVARMMVSWLGDIALLDLLGRQGGLSTRGDRIARIADQERKAAAPRACTSSLSAGGSSARAVRS